MKTTSLPKAFTMVELLIAVSVIAVLSIAAYLGTQRAQVGSLNNKVSADLLMISQSLEAYRQDHGGSYPVPEVGGTSHVRCYSREGLSVRFTDDCEGAEIRQGMMDNELLTKRYLLEVPVDPRTGSRYAYGVSADGQLYEVAGVVRDEEGNYRARVEGNTGPGNTGQGNTGQGQAGQGSTATGQASGPSGLIRSLDGKGVVTDGGERLPYSPDHLEISATLSGADGVTIVGPDGEEKEITDTLYAGDTITVSAGGSVMVTFSEGTMMAMGDEGNDTVLELKPETMVVQNDGRGTVSDMELSLFSGKIWSKVVKLSEGSKMQVTIESTGAIAGVRGTEFGIDADDGTGETPGTLIVLSGSVGVGEQWQEEGRDDLLVSSELDELPKSALMFVEGPDEIMELGAGLPEWVQRLRELEGGELEAMVPYLIGSYSGEVAEAHQVYLSFNGARSDGLEVFDGLEVYGQSQVAGYRALEAEALPLLEIPRDMIGYDSEEGVHVFSLDYRPGSSPLWREGGGGGGETGDLELMVLRAYREGPGGERSHSTLSWPPRGLQKNPEAGGSEDWFVLDGELYPELAGSFPGEVGGEGDGLAIPISGPEFMSLNGSTIETIGGFIWSSSIHNINAQTNNADTFDIEINVNAGPPIEVVTNAPVGPGGMIDYDWSTPNEADADIVLRIKANGAGGNTTTTTNFTLDTVIWDEVWIE